MPAVEKIAALFQQLTREDVDALPPAQRERFAQLCLHWGNFAAIRPEAPKAGVLVELRSRRAHDE
jgi:hypothetical protein